MQVTFDFYSLFIRKLTGNNYACVPRFRMLFFSQSNAEYNLHGVVVERSRKLPFVSGLESHTQTNHSGVIAGK